MPTSERLEFMQKYAVGPPYSLRMGLAVDVWSEAAVLIAARVEITSTISAMKVKCEEFKSFMWRELSLYCTYAIISYL